MEYPTLITTGGPWYGPPFARLLELVTMHEFGHQYFYGLVATDEVTWPFLDEGLNSYAESEALGAWLGAGSAASVGGFTLSDAAVQSVFGAGSEHDEPIAQAAFQFRTGSDYGHLVYERTASIVETFRQVYGEAAVSRALGRYTRRFRFEHPGPDELIASFETELGARAAATLRAALFDKGWVDYTVTSVFSKGVEEPGGIFDRDGKREILASKAVPNGGYEGWVLVTRRGTLTFPVDVELDLEDGATQRVHWDGGEALRIPYSGKVALRAAVVDPDHAVLLDDDPTNNHASAEGRTYPSRAMERVAYWAELWLSAFAP
jgi:aminopeptidase N